MLKWFTQSLCGGTLFMERIIRFIDIPERFNIIEVEYTTGILKEASNPEDTRTFVFTSILAAFGRSADA